MKSKAAQKTPTATAAANEVKKTAIDAIQALPTHSNVKSEYSSHKEQLQKASPTIERINEMATALLEAYSKATTEEVVTFVEFGKLTKADLVEAFIRNPIIIKATFASVNIAARAIKRDLGIDIDTYATSIKRAHAEKLAEYAIQFLPKRLAIPALMELDRYFWTDKEMRAEKGNWEKRIVSALCDGSGKSFRKTKFKSGGKKYELDAAHPHSGEDIEIGIDIKRIESPRDHMKRGDEIISKAIKFKKEFPNGIFVAVVYFPFPDQHGTLEFRLKTDDIDYIYFAAESEDSISSCIQAIIEEVILT